MVCIEQAGGHQHRAVVVQEPCRAVIDPFPGKLFDDDLPVASQQFEGALENAIQTFCMVQRTLEHHDVIFARDVVDIGMNGQHAAFGGRFHRFGVAINAGHPVTHIHQRSGQSATAATHFQDSGGRPWEKRPQVGKGMGHCNGCQIHEMSRPEQPGGKVQAGYSWSASSGAAAPFESRSGVRPGARLALHRL